MHCTIFFLSCNETFQPYFAGRKLLHGMWITLNGKTYKHIVLKKRFILQLYTVENMNYNLYC